jgi:putative DNA primase/helicase
VIEEAFRDALRQNRIEYDGPIVINGEIQRIKAKGDHKNNSWYALHPGVPVVAAFGCWKRAVSVNKWCERNSENLTQSERATVRRRQHEITAKVQAEALARQKKARKTAAWILNRSRPARGHLYLSRKRVKVFGDLRASRGQLVVPLRDPSGELHSLQFIYADGTKKFLPGGRVAGCFFTLADEEDGPLVVCEGYATGATVHEATGHAVTCCMDCGNLLEVAKAARERWPGREIIIAADNDQFTDGNPGLTKAAAAAKAIRARLAAPRFDDLAGKPTDFNDLALAQGLGAVRQQVGSARVPEESSVDLAASPEPTPPAPPYVPPPYVPPPLDLFPDFVKNYIREGGSTFDCDAAFFMSPLLSVAAAMIGNARSVRLKQDHVEPPIINTATIARTGSGKSPVLEAVTEPLRLRERKLIQENKEAQANFEDALAKWEARSKKDRAGGKKPKKPPLLTCLMDDATIEAVASHLNDNPRGIALIKDELSHWFESFDQYHDRGGADVSRWLMLWMGTLFCLDRASGGGRGSRGRSYRIPDPRLSITGGVVPAVFKRLLTDDYFERGLPARFLFSMPSHNRPRKYVDEDIPDLLKRQVRDLFDRLAALRPARTKHGDFPALLGLAPEAKKTFIGFADECARRAFEANPREAAQWSKLASYSARLALVGQLMRDPDAEQISPEIMRAACDLARWFGLEAERIYALIGETDAQRDQRKLVEFIRARGGIVTERDVYSNYNRLKNKSEETTAWLEQLVRSSFGCWEPVPTTAKGGHPTRKFCLFQGSQTAQPPDLLGEGGSAAGAGSRNVPENDH